MPSGSRPDPAPHAPAVPSAVAGRAGDPLRVAYILKMFPRLSETFILNELLELERRGTALSVFSLMHPADGRFHGRLAELRLTAEYLVAGKPEAWWEAIRALPREHVAPMAKWEECADFLDRHGVAKNFELLLRAVVIAAEAKRRGIRHFHAHFATVATHVAAVASHLSGIPFSFTAHAKDIFRTTVRRELFRELVDRAAFMITVSDFNRRYILENTPGIDAGKVIRLYNGIDLDFFRRDGAEAAPRSRPHIVSVGRLVPKKGFDHLLRALAICRDRGLDLTASIIGDGEEEARLRALRDQLGLADRVELAGALPQEEVRRRMAEASFIALACVPDDDGNMDALPTVLLEALALDLPIACTTLTGQPEIVGDEAGVMAEPGDDEAFARVMLGLWDRIRGGSFPRGVARARAERLFNLRANAGTLAGYFARSAGGRPAR